MYMRFRLVPKSMTLNDLWARFKVTDSLNAAKVAKYSLVMTPTPCRVAGCMISIRPTYSAQYIYLLTYTVGSGHIKPAISPARLKIERKLLLTAYINSYTGFRLPPKCMILNDLWVRSKVIHSLNAAQMTKYSLVMTPPPCRVAGSTIGLLMYAPVHLLTLLTYLLTYLLTQNNQCFGDSPVICSFLTFQRMICLPFHCLW